MTARRATVVCFALAACGSLQFQLKPQVLENSFETNSASGSCPLSGQPFGAARFGVKAFSEALGVDPSVACLTAATFAVTAEVVQAGPSQTPGDACAVGQTAPSGTVTLTGFTLSYDWLDKGATRTGSYVAHCPDTAIDLGASGDDINAKVNACLEALAGAADPFLRVAYNHHPEALTLAATGTCSPGACYHFTFSFKLRLLSGTATVGACPE